MGRHKDFDAESTRMQILLPIMLLGFLPYTSLWYFVEEHYIERIRRMVRRMCEERILVCKKTAKGQKYYILNKPERIKPQLLAKIPSELLRIYNSPELQDRRAKLHKKEDCDRILSIVDSILFMCYAGARTYPGEREIFAACKNTQELAGGYYPSTECKQIPTANPNQYDYIIYDQIRGSSMAGLYVTPDLLRYMVYALGRHNMIFNNNEMQMRDYLYQCRNMSDIPRGNDITPILLYQDRRIQPLVEIMELSRSYSEGAHYNDKNKRNMLNMQYFCYKKAYVLPASHEGVQLMRIMSHKGWEERIQGLLSPDGTSPNADYDWIDENDTQVSTFFIFCVPDLLKLHRYRLYPVYAYDGRTIYQNIVCFDFQRPLIQQVLYSNGTDPDIHINICPISFQTFLDIYRDRYGDF